jgi:hypothetical protein
LFLSTKRIESNSSKSSKGLRIFLWIKPLNIEKCQPKERC